MSKSTKQEDNNGNTADNPPFGQIADLPRREIFFRRGRRRGGRLERMGFVLGVALQAILPEIALGTGHAQGNLPLEPVEEVMETDNQPVIARSEHVVEPVQARVEPEVPMELIEDRAPVVEPDVEMDEVEEARGENDLAGGLDLDLAPEEPETVAEPEVAAPTILRSCLKRSSPGKDDESSPKRRKLSFSRSVDVQHHQRVLANNLNRPYVMTGEPTEAAIERLKRPSDRVKPSRVLEEEVVELLEASGGPETLPRVENPPTHRGCTCGEVCDENCSCLLLGIKCSGHFGCLCSPDKCGTGRPTAAANARLYVPGRAVSATEEYDKLEAKEDSTISSVDDDNLFGDSVGGSDSVGGTTMVLNQTIGEGEAETSNCDLDASFVGEEGHEDEEEEQEQEELEDLDASFVVREEVVEEVEEEESSFQDLDASMIQPGDDESAPDSDASLSEVNEQHPTQPDSDSPNHVSAQPPPTDDEYEDDDDKEEEEEADARTNQLVPVDSPTLLQRVSSLFGSVFSRSPPSAAADDDVEDQSSEGQADIEVAEKDEVEDPPVGYDEDVEDEAAMEDIPVDEADIPINQFVSIATLDSPSHLVGSVLEELDEDDVAAGFEDEEEEIEVVPAVPVDFDTSSISLASDIASVDADDEELDAPGQTLDVRVPDGNVGQPASPPGSPPPSSSSSDSDSSDDGSDSPARSDNDDDDDVPELPFDSTPEQFPTRLLDILPALVDQREIDSCLPNAWIGGGALFAGLLKTATEFNRKYAGTGRRCGVIYPNVFVDALELVEQDLAAGNGNGGRNGRQAAALNELNPAQVAQSIVYGNSWSELLIPLNIRNQHWAIAVVKRNAVQAVILDSLPEPTDPQLKELRKEQDEMVKLALRKCLVAVGSIDPNDKTTHRFKVRHTFRKLRCIQEDGFNCGIFSIVHGRRVLERLSFNGATRAGKDAEVDLDEERVVLKANLEATKAYFDNLARNNVQLRHGPGGSLPITASKTPVVLRWSGKC